MKYVHTLHVNAKEIDILNEALRLYRAHCNHRLESGNFGLYSREAFISYRAKVVNMSKVIEEVKHLPKPTVSEAGKIPEDQCVTP